MADELGDYKTIPSDVWEKMIEGLIQTMNKAHAKSLSALLDGLAKLNCKWKDLQREFREAVYESLQRVFDSKYDPQLVSISLYSLGQMEVQSKELPSMLVKSIFSSIKLKIKEMTPQGVSNTLLG